MGCLGIGNKIDSHVKIFRLLILCRVLSRWQQGQRGDARRGEFGSLLHDESGDAATLGQTGRIQIVNVTRPCRHFEKAVGCEWRLKAHGEQKRMTIETCRSTESAQAEIEVDRPRLLRSCSERSAGVRPRRHVC